MDYENCFKEKTIGEIIKGYNVNVYGISKEYPYFSIKIKEYTAIWDGQFAAIVAGDFIIGFRNNKPEVIFYVYDLSEGFRINQIQGLLRAEGKETVHKYYFNSSKDEAKYEEKEK